ncbi:MAG: BCD family MFS transporter [Chloroflexi bacterium]|nr:BCD family MFS transporter [Chloroflexota bacterium]
MSVSNVKSSLEFSLGRTLRLSSFHIGSAMGDILVTSIWNRIMISNFGIPAAPVSLLIALRYLLFPISLWAGFMSDTRPLFGLRRTPYIWAGRGMMVVSLPLLGLSLGRLELAQADVLGWTYAVVSSLLYGVGLLISGSPFLALVRDSAPRPKQGIAISMVQTALIIFFALVGIGFSFWMQAYDARVFWQMALTTMIGGGLLWYWAIAGIEKNLLTRANLPPPAPESRLNLADFGATFKKIWADARTRGFFIFLSLATMAAWAQDAILEPFGAETFHFPVSQTTRFNAYWQGATVVTLIGGAMLWRKRPPETHSGLTSGGLMGMFAGMALLTAAAFSGQAALIPLSLLLFGGGFGVYTFGGLSLMAVMSSDKEAGLYLGLWTIAVTVFKGLGVFLGGAIRDWLLLNLNLPATVSYGAIFALEALGLLGAALVLYRVDVAGFARDAERGYGRIEAQIASAD